MGRLRGQLEARARPAHKGACVHTRYHLTLCVEDAHMWTVGHFCTGLHEGGGVDWRKQYLLALWRVGEAQVLYDCGPVRPKPASQHSF